MGAGNNLGIKNVNKDFVLNYKTFNVFLNLGIFLCWGCLLASVITGIFEHKLENKISDKNSEKNCSSL